MTRSLSSWDSSSSLKASDNSSRKRFRDVIMKCKKLSKSVYIRRFVNFGYTSPFLFRCHKKP